MIYFEVVILIFFGISILLVSFMLIKLSVKKYRKKQYVVWNNDAQLLVRDTIFFEDNLPQTDHIIPIPSSVQKNMPNERFREVIVDVILYATKNISGNAEFNLKKLYEQLNLHLFALENLKDKRWYVKAKAIQELGVMNQMEYLNKIYRFTNNKKELVRMEAQLAVIKLLGFEGLRFLDVISYKLTEWNQIKLLNELARLPNNNFTGIEKWLRSANVSVVAFALKLARNYHRFELYNEILNCLDHEDDDVRYQAILTLQKIYTVDTSKILLNKFSKEIYKNQFAIIKTLKSIAYDDDIPQIINLIDRKDNELKREMVRSILSISPFGLTLLREHPDVDFYPINEMIAQVKSELL